jgi:hypothetical protein
MDRTGFPSGPSTPQTPESPTVLNDVPRLTMLSDVENQTDGAARERRSVSPRSDEKEGGGDSNQASAESVRVSLFANVRLILSDTFLSL